MHRIAGADLRLMIGLIIQCSRLKRHRSGRPVPFSLETNQGQEQLTELLCDQLDNESVMVVAADTVGFGHSARRGKWDVDEPAPATVPLPPPPPSG